MSVTYPQQGAKARERSDRAGGGCGRMDGGVHIPGLGKYIWQFDRVSQNGMFCTLNVIIGVRRLCVFYLSFIQTF